jgi:hypothetical protein
VSNSAEGHKSVAINLGDVLLEQSWALFRCAQQDVLHNLQSLANRFSRERKHLKTRLAA